MSRPTAAQVPLELIEEFGLDWDDLNIDLGPLGPLL
jgi:hypothetical protein